jgi:hypothetical protein
MVARVHALVPSRTKVFDIGITMWYNISMLEIFVC